MANPSCDNSFKNIECLRSLVLSQAWASDLDPEETGEYLATLSDNRFASKLFEKNDAPFFQPRGGFSTFERQKILSEALSDAHADFIPLTIDSYSRHNDYDKAAVLLEQSEFANKEFLNGYPLINHGHLITRKLFDNIDRPICLRHGTPDARLLVEVALAAGLTEIEGGGLCYSIPYSSGYPLDKSLLNWQYVDRICAYFSTHERPIHRESFGPMTATLVPPAMVIAVSVIELLLAAEQGVKSMSVGFGQTGSILQDVATAKAMRKVCGANLKRFGFNEVKLRLVYHQWMGAFPVDRQQADILIGVSAFISKLINADKLVVKTRDEAFGIPTVEANCNAISSARFAMRSAFAGFGVSDETVEEESEMIAASADAVLEAIYTLPCSTFLTSIVKGVELGYVDIPFAPHSANANKLMCMRDKEGAIRIMKKGGVPIPEHVMEFELSRLKSRMAENKSVMDKILEDIYYFM